MNINQTEILLHYSYLLDLRMIVSPSEGTTYGISLPFAARGRLLVSWRASTPRDLLVRFHILYRHFLFNPENTNVETVHC